MLFSDTHWNKTSSQSIVITWKVVCENNHESLVVKELPCVCETAVAFPHSLWACHDILCSDTLYGVITWISSWSSSKDDVATLDSYLQVLVDFLFISWTVVLDNFLKTDTPTFTLVGQYFYHILLVVIKYCAWMYIDWMQCHGCNNNLTKI